MRKILLALCVLSSLSGCSYDSEPVNDVKTVASAPVEEVVASAPVEEVVASAPVEEVVASAPVEEVAPKLSHNSVYFEFAKYGIDATSTDVIKANANYLITNKDAKVQIQGNTDSTGSVEFNLSLGQKRADAVKKALVVSGVQTTQVEATSNGKLKPKFSNTSEENRAMNRRVDIMYLTMPPVSYSLDTQNSLPMINDSFYKDDVQK